MRIKLRKARDGRVVVGVSMTPDMANALVRIANEDDRTLSSMCRIAIKNYWKIEEKEEQPCQEPPSRPWA